MSQSCTNWVFENVPDDSFGPFITPKNVFVVSGLPKAMLGVPTILKSCYLFEALHKSP